MNADGSESKTHSIEGHMLRLFEHFTPDQREKRPIHHATCRQLHVGCFEKSE